MHTVALTREGLQKREFAVDHSVVTASCVCTNWHNLGRQENRPTTAKYSRLVPKMNPDRM